VLAVTSPLCLLTVHAHPDDEASKGAPTLAMYGALGVRTVLVCCTGGEEGDLQNPHLREPGQPFHGLTPEQDRELLARLRPLELARSAEVIGFDHVEMLGYRDSGMPDSPANAHPDCFHMAPIDQAAARLVEAIRRERPQVIVTYGDDQKGYPHPDHLKVHEVTVAAWDRAGDPLWRPELGAAWQPHKLYYSTWSKARLMAVHEGMLRLRGESPFDQAWLDRPGADHRITTRVDIGAYLGAQRCVEGARHSGRPHRGMVVRPRRPRARRGLSLRGLDPCPVAGGHARRRRGRDRSVRRCGRRHVGPRPARRGTAMTASASVQYRVVFGKNDEAVEGPDDADVVVTVAAADTSLDPSVAFMQGKLKASGSTGALFDALRSGAAAAAISRLASRP
jgi:mycothiol S-conjugate amidase